jgi:hypothetical protein
MAQQDFWKVKIGTTWLTDDGTEDGLPCQVDVPGLGPLFLEFAQSIRKAADGTPYAFILPSDWQGVDLLINVFTVSEEVFTAIIAEINAALTAQTTMAMSLIWNTIDFEFTALPDVPTPPGSFTAGRLNNVGFKFTIEAKTP